MWYAEHEVEQNKTKTKQKLSDDMEFFMSDHLPLVVKHCFKHMQLDINSRYSFFLFLFFILKKTLLIITKRLNHLSVSLSLFLSVSLPPPPSLPSPCLPYALHPSPTLPLSLLSPPPPPPPPAPTHTHLCAFLSHGKPMDVSHPLSMFLCNCKCCKLRAIVISSVSVVNLNRLSLKPFL